MPNYRGGGRGGKRSQKGKNRRFTDVEELKEQSKKAEKEKEWRRQQGLPSDTESEDEAEEGAAAKPKAPGLDSSSSESDSEDDADQKAKGVSHLIQIENPNRAANKTKKVTELTEAAEGPTLSRKEREEIQKQQAAAHYRKLHNEGKTDEARADLARLAIIRKQREDAAKKKSDAEKVKTAATSAAEQKLLDKKKKSTK